MTLIKFGKKMNSRTNLGQKLWERAKRIVPGGNQLLSKRSEMFLPELWPSYYDKAKGCEVWDLDGNHYYDFAGMGVTACVLGYSDEDVNSAVIKAVQQSAMCTLNAPEEVQLAEKLVEIHPWAEMVRFSKTGGEACAIAVRIARAASGKDHVAFCGYHGWHDWYLSANLGDSSNLNGQLLPGLDTKGVPEQLQNSSHPFYYNNVESFERVIDVWGDKIGVIMLEPRRGTTPEIGFLEHIRKTASDKNIVLVFDEVTSAFHNNYGGIHLTLNINPDIAVFAKALGNGYPISAIIGKQAVMDVAQDTFISSTMWTERAGFAAALATLKKMKDNNIQKDLVEKGRLIREGWNNISADSGVHIKTSGLESIPSFVFDYSNSLELLTYFNQEMLKKGFLTNGMTAATIAYTDEIIANYLECANKVFTSIKRLSMNVSESLTGSVKHSTFARLTD